ncbi:hypothetical protein K1T71_000200 [Dendrolimus kikuchii]|uniref:Uncharacterized protein n=1 Tax=Dendrolimus kikuchii TaxID=765133 RepID=A0ACC1DJH3_9NEOP|nr:hypothetical protein K1T71_000200 [Dendrolimus kikuchii]
MYLPHSYYLLMHSYLSDRLFQVQESEESSELHKIQAGVPQGSVLGPVLYTIYTADLPEVAGVMTATFADDTALLATSKDLNSASEQLQKGLDEIWRWLNKWKIRASPSKSLHITFTLRKGDCPPVHLGENILPHSDRVKYLGMHLDRRLTWKYHAQTKRDEMNLKYKTMLWLLGRNSKLSIDNKLLIYNMVLKPIWTYGIQIWGSASNFNISMIQRLQNVILRTISGVPWYIRNSEIHEHLGVKTTKEEIRELAKSYQCRLALHVNKLAAKLMQRTYPSRLKRHDIQKLQERTSP